MTPVEYYWLHKNKKIATQVSSPLASAAITSSSKPHNKSSKLKFKIYLTFNVARINTPEGIRARKLYYFSFFEILNRKRKENSRKVS